MIPQSVINIIRFHVSTTQCLKVARETDSRLGGHRYEAEAYLSNADKIKASVTRLREITNLCERNGVDINEVFALIGQQPQTLSAEARAIVENW